MFAAATRVSRRDSRHASTAAGSCASGRASTGTPKAPTTVFLGWEAGRAVLASATPTPPSLSRLILGSPTTPLAPTITASRPTVTSPRSSSLLSPSIRRGLTTPLIPWYPRGKDVTKDEALRDCLVRY